MALDPNILLQGANMRAAQSQDLMNTLQGVYQSYIQNKRMQEAKLEQQRAESMKPENIMAKAVELGGVDKLSPQEQARLKAYDIERTTQMQSDMLGNIYPKYGSVVGQIGGNQLFPAQGQGSVAPQYVTPQQLEAPQQPMGADLMPLDQMVMPVQKGLAELPPVETPVDRAGVMGAGQELIEQSGIAGSPVGRRMLLDAGLKLNEKTFDKQVDFAKEQMKTEKGRQQIANKLKDVVRINEQLRKEGGLMTEEGGVSNLLKMATATGKGGLAEAALSPKTKRLREDYKNAVGGIIPYYIAANNLPATVVDTEQFAQRIINAFGDPSGFYETNVGALGRAAEEFGADIQAPDFSGFKIVE